MTIEWDKVTTVTPWRYGLALAVGLEPPAPLMAEVRNALPLVMNGAWRQGGYAFGRTAPRALIFVDGEALNMGKTAERLHDRFPELTRERDALAAQSMIVETFETACTWDRFDELKAAVTAAATAAMQAAGVTGVLTCRFTHVYPDGPAPYFGIYAAGHWGRTVAQWDDLKIAVSEALHDAGGTITHHHAVGRDHRPWYDRQRPEPFAIALRAAKAALDPAGILNPGVLV